mmetsp:Transcript_1554/g.1982  ORF Transcript_1554/g.1982 Transcript_1554/m.1982 type:complete len:374 (-) Transcript_1554:102-1223(-)|eukprot:CAMPEP_0172516246 /NCGR_PEP_ID=MMETSP1066-20121228/274641_1 /TAXON_ID=671091 /ORGANISM="Coscinodiscus wailesii, Strain CCMP2513" /LENGTH=373 /DNA_ID=CAMNT_0013297637 /DNA_START=42 /DNA_END=1163 /DNA_ORIENTATION=+
MGRTPFYHGALALCTILVLLNVPLPASCFSTPTSSTRYATSLSMSTPSRFQPPPKGCAATPANKKKICVFGGGGYLSATIYGYLQRTSSLFPTGTAPPRTVVATAWSSLQLNKILGRHFRLAYANEDSIALTDASDPHSLAGSLDGVDAVVLGTVCACERRPVTGNTYEGGNPNKKTVEFYLDGVVGVGADEVMEGDAGFHLGFFRDCLTACREMGVQHVVVLETPRTRSLGVEEQREFGRILEEEGVPFTYICTGGKEWESIPGYTFQEGVRDVVEVQGKVIRRGSGSGGAWLEESLSGRDVEVGDSGAMAREDIAAVAVQALMSLDWEKSRVLQLKTMGQLEKEDEGRNPRYDRVWCKRSELLAQALAFIE